jgi:zinc D-Ala-D-Ala dipeptidase
MRQVITIAITVAFAHVANANDPLKGALQCLVVRTPSWTAPIGTMSVWERESLTSGWIVRHKNFPVVVGRNGLAWGPGITDIHVRNEPHKREGDSRAPAGVFKLRGAFGYAPSARTKMPYQQITSDILCIDDSRSRYYNQIVDQRKIGDRDWNSAEKMRRTDIRYRWGMFVTYNARAVQNAGSCIFLHVWISPNEPTVGCTAMSEKDILDVIEWLDPTANPMLVELPQNIYERYEGDWNLPHFRGLIMLARPSGGDFVD